jgi:hypothetical protein
LTNTKPINPIPPNKMAKLAGWASAVNIVSWLLTAVPGFLSSAWSALELVAIPLSGIIALLAGILGLRSKAKMSDTGAGQCLIGIFVGVVNVILIALVLVGISAMVNCC